MQQKGICYTLKQVRIYLYFALVETNLDVKSILNVGKSTILEEFVTLHGQTLRTLLLLQTGEQ